MKQNLHTHTTFCDGVNTPEELVREAIERGFDSIGFSGHGHTIYDESYCMGREETKTYRNEILSLQQKYADSIRVFLGIEQDYFSDPIDCQWDYIIGSVHYIVVGGTIVPVDESREVIEQTVRQYYDDDIYAFISDYYKTVSNVPKVTGCDIIGHFDLISKFNENNDLFDEHHPVYIQAWTAALDKIFGTAEISSPFGDYSRQGTSQRAVPVFEINTGAIARGYRTLPYPSLDMLKAIRERSGRIIITSDCHDKKCLDMAYDLAVKLAREAGFTEQAYFDGKEFTAIPL